jgi:hypothetical protein
MQSKLWVHSLHSSARKQLPRLKRMSESGELASLHPCMDRRGKNHHQRRSIVHCHNSMHRRESVTRRALCYPPRSRRRSSTSCTQRSPAQWRHGPSRAARGGRSSAARKLARGERGFGRQGMRTVTRSRDEGPCTPFFLRDRRWRQVGEKVTCGETPAWCCWRACPPSPL